MEGKNFLVVDIGNSGYKALTFDDGYYCDYQIPNAISLFDERPYDEEDLEFEANLIVEVKSPAIIDKREIFYIGKAAIK